MTIKELAYFAQQHLQVSTSGLFKRAHVYELLAASFGFNSYAAFGVDTVFRELRQNDKRVVPQSAFITRRCIELGYQPDKAVLVPAALDYFLAQRQIGVASISSLVRRLRGESPNQNDYLVGDANRLFSNDQDDLFDPADGGEFGPILRNALEAAAIKGNALAHYALALIHDPDGEIDEDDEPDAGSSYWHSQGQQGRVLTGVEKEWAEAYEARVNQTEKYLRHLQEAGRLGNQHALLDLADRFDDPFFFEQSRRDVDADPAAVAAIAERMGRFADARHWLTVAAESGDTDAMLQLIEEHDQDDLLRCWMWVYLSQLVGTDLARDAHRAINGDGSDYDDDVGGPAYVAGRDGVNLNRLSTEQDTAARLAAQEVFDQIQRNGDVRPLP
jgi:TPR repeat protein